MNQNATSLQRELLRAVRSEWGDVASVSGRRIETGQTAARELRLAVPCIVGFAESPQLTEDSGVPDSGNSYSVRVDSADWQDHKPPQVGDAWTVEGYPVLKCAYVEPHPYGWKLTCRSEVTNG